MQGKDLEGGSNPPALPRAGPGEREQRSRAGNGRRRKDMRAPSSPAEPQPPSFGPAQAAGKAGGRDLVPVLVHHGAGPENPSPASGTGRRPFIG